MQPFSHSGPILGLTLLFLSLITALSLSNAQQLSAPLSLGPLSTQEATDTVAIQQVLNAFGVALDQRRFDLFDHIFTADVTVNLNIQGIPILRNLNDVAASMGRLLQGTTTLHAQSTHYIRLADPTHAVATTYNSATYVTRQRQTVMKLGRYEDQLVKTANGWLISNRILFHVAATNPLLAFTEDNSTSTFF